MNRYTFLYALLLFTGLILQGCKKQADPSPMGTGSTSGATYYVRFKIDGVQKEFTKETGSVILSPQSDLNHSIGITGSLKTGATRDNTISLFIIDKVPIVTNTTYTDHKTSLSQSKRALILFITYSDESAIAFSTFADDTPTSLNAVSDSKILVTESTPLQTSGTFSGTTYTGNNGVLTSKHVLTDGQFVVKRIN